MAELKYDLMLVPTKTDKRIYEQPWYKERLRTHYIKSMGPGATSKFFDSGSWSFIKDGLDDFRDGLPPVVEGEEIIQGYKGLRPNLMGSSDNTSAVKQPAAPKRFTKDQICYARTTPQQQDRRDHIDDIEFGLKQHPLALYPHLVESVPPDVFEDVVDILDPELNVGSDEEEEDEYENEGNEEEAEEEADQFPEANAPPQDVLDDQGLANTKVMGAEARQKLNVLTTTIKLPMILKRYIAKRPQCGKRRPSHVTCRITWPHTLFWSCDQEGDRKPVKNPYKWLPKKDDKDKKEKKKGDRRSPSPEQDAHIKYVAKEFCDWVSDLGGETNNIEESTIMSLFASGYETKPALSVPIHVVELSNVPAELRMTTSAPPPSSQPADHIPKHSQDTKNWSYSGSYHPSWVKQRYGAWYLPAKTWRKMPAEEPLQDPKNLKDLETSEANAKSTNLDSELAPMHGVHAFMDFIEKKNQRRPEFLNRVRDIQEDTAKEEAVKLETEMQSKKRANKSRQSNT